MATQYPNSIDTAVTLPLVFDLISPVLADDHNRLRNAIVAIQSELGTNPSGTYANTKDRFDNIDTLVNTIVAYIMSLSAYQISIADLDGYFASTTVEDALKEIAQEIDTLSASVTTTIGAAEDGSYTDGLYTDFTPTTQIGVAVDRFNEVLKNIGPQPAPDLSNISFSTASGIEGKISFGASNSISGYINVGNQSGEGALDINATFPNGSTARRGIYASGAIAKAGVLAANVAAGPGSPTASYPALAFGNADLGNLEIHVNGVLIHSVDLSVFGSGSSLTSGTGFTLSAATSINFPNGTTFALHKYRTGTWTVSTTHEQNGYNFVQIKHVIGMTTLSSNFFEWVIDNSATATSYASESLGSLSLTGSKHLSGVEYYTGGTATYTATVQNPYRNTYNSGASALFHTSSTNCTLSASAIPVMTTEADTIAVSKTATISAVTLHDEQITARTSTLRSVQATVASTGATQSFILLNAATDTASATSELMDGETYRVPSNRSLTDTTGLTSSGASLWDSTISIASGTPGYSDGLIVYNRKLYYPSSPSVVNSGDFSIIGNGPVGNPDYSATVGTRVYLRYFHFSTAAQNFSLNITHTGVNFKTVASGLSVITGDANLEILAPNTTTDGISAEFKDAIVAYTADDAIGCHAPTYGSTAYTAWGLTLGTKSTATSGNAIIIRVTAPAGWTGTISDISLTAV